MFALTARRGCRTCWKTASTRYLRANLSSGLDPAIAARIKDPVEGSIQTLDNGRIMEDSAVVGLFLVPIIFVMVFLFASQATSGYLMSGVVEEKTNRIMEILITSVTPFQLLFGKIIGLGLLGLTQLVIWLIAGYDHTDARSHEQYVHSAG